jgi:hypothetical protein
LVLNNYENRKKYEDYEDEQGKCIHDCLISLIIWISRQKSRGNF